MNNASLVDVLREVRSELRALRNRVEARVTTTHAMITTREAERLYRLSHGTVDTDFRNGLIRGRIRSSRGRTGKALFVSPVDCERRYGPSYAEVQS